MNIKNEMEHLVLEEVGRTKKLGNTAYAGCWCTLCEMDIVALALTLLPPLYCRAETFGYAAGLIKAGTICDAVQSALQRISLWPKHRPGTPPPSPDAVALINYTFEVGTTMVGAALDRSATRCDCDNCRSDTLAYALNRYPSKYGVTRGGQRCLDPHYLDFMRHELGMLMKQAARIVSSRPHHRDGF